jgi:Ca2+-binding RTX toxin-like protein
MQNKIIALALALLPALVLAAEIIGTPGPDVLEGTPEADTIDGQGGADTMMGLPGNDTYIVGQVDDEVLEAVGDGVDTVRASVSYTLPGDVENLTLTGVGANNGTGNALNNRITGNNANNRLNGMGGADRMFGRRGNDTYYVNSAGDKVIEALNAGIDSVRSTRTYTLPANVEKLVLIGNAAANGTGNSLANTITGNANANSLSGLAGDDILNGGAGNDELNGGPGNDRLSGGPGLDAFRFDEPLDAATNVDRINEFTPADDEMRLIGEVFTGLSAAGAIPATAFRVGIAATEPTHRILYDPASGNVRYDEDGSGPANAVRFATLVSLPAVTNADFIVVDPVVTDDVSFVDDLQPIFNSRCIQCHIGAAAPQGLRLDAANSYARLVNVPSNEVPSLMRVEPGDPDNSYLIQKLEGTAAVGARMPLGGPYLPQETIDEFRRWITEGANP